MSDLIERLADCPFCGSEAHTQIHMTESLHSHDIVPWLTISCPECEVPSVCWEDFEHAIEQWNRRDELSRLQSLSDQNRLTGGWRDIESAPKDGSLVDVWIAPLAPDGTALTPCRGPDAYCQDGKWYLVGGRTDVRIWHRITHWMPPPAGPPLPLPGGEEKR